MGDEHDKSVGEEFGKLFSGVEKQAKKIYVAGKSEAKKKLDETSGYQELKDEIVTLKFEIDELKREVEKLKGQNGGQS